MGGMVAVAGRKKDNSTFAFKVHTSFLASHINDLKNLSEEHLMQLMSEHNLDLKKASLIEHDDYDNTRAFLAPYHYGILFFDYLNQVTLCAHHYSSFIILGSSPIISDYETLATSRFKFSIRRYGSEEVTELNPFENDIIRIGYGIGLGTCYHLAQTLRMGGEIKYNEHVFNAQDVNAIYASIYGANLTQMSHDEQNAHIKARQKAELKKEEPEYRTMDDYSDVTLCIPGWTFLHPETLNEVYEYLKENNIALSEEEDQVWQKEIKREERK